MSPRTSGGSVAEPVSTTAAVLQGIQTGAGILGQLFGDDIPKEQLDTLRSQILISLFQDEVARQQENAERKGRFEASAPLVRDLFERLHGPSRAEVARSRPQTFQAQNEQGQPIQGVATEQGGGAAPQEELDQLMPDFERFRAQRERARQMTSGITADNLFEPRQSVLPLVSEFDAAREGLLAGRGRGRAREEEMLRNLVEGGQLPEIGQSERTRAEAIKKKFGKVNPNAMDLIRGGR